MRLNDGELAEIRSRAAAAGMTMARFSREAALKAQIVNRRDWQAFVFHLAKVGANLNQISRWCNSYKSSADTRAVILALLRIERAVRDATLRSATDTDEAPEALTS